MKRRATTADGNIRAFVAAKDVTRWPQDDGFPDTMYLIGAMTDTCVHGDYQSGDHADYHVLLFVDDDGIRISINHR